MVNSLVWSPEEAKYLKAIFHWQEAEPSLEEERRRRQAEEDERKRQEERKPAGEFRVLVIGGRGTGKTAILTRSIQFGEGTFHGETLPPDPFYEGGCRHPITLEIETPALPTSATAHALTSSTTATNPTPRGTTIKSHPHPHINSPQPTRLYKQPPHSHNHNQQQHQQQPPKTHSQTYLIDALEMPTAHLPSNPLLAQALSITEAAVLVYSVRDPASLQLARGLAEFMREHFAPATPSSSSAASEAVASPGGGGGRRGGAGSRAGGGGIDRGRAYPIVLGGE
ncbi:predicted protein [Chaetomium globosum CBS 148.51]|uniref:Uncharacterized protein n=1 Tax=Chaetomium globosum (strain ATCC 6205 / CBS 148.51 / DSM 1962 / NBRC 6347 / NRRL 1970) TaxID=306901 RepID=Q2HGK8_CHAGB|nr:uncharacterized protein CHGG_00646 [Chaetomium globosum CBS 148.51]EAQ92411.1 predicted protein [Chaetomium globosum CBS 148.51]